MLKVIVIVVNNSLNTHTHVYSNTVKDSSVALYEESMVVNQISSETLLTHSRSISVT